MRGLEQFKVGGLDGTPMLFLLAEGLPLLTIRTDNMAGDPWFNHLNQWGIGHGDFLQFLEETYHRPSIDFPHFCHTFGKEWKLIEP